VTQYTSIFVNRASENVEQHATFLQSYTHVHVSQLMDLLNGTVSRIEDPTSLTSLLTQLAYCATSLSRVGLDFRILLQQPFVDAVIMTATKSFLTASAKFLNQLEECTASSIHLVYYPFIASFLSTTVTPRSGRNFTGACRTCHIILVPPCS
jgi:conserved oligomeric Golgi complex subunit 8